MFQSMARGDEDCDTGGDGTPSENSPESKQAPINLKDILSIVTEGTTITEALKKAIVEAGVSFGLTVVDDAMLARQEADRKSERVCNHIGHNKNRMVRRKVKMTRPKEIILVVKKHGEKERAHTRTVNQKLAISVS
jgi:hypothetical protein